MPYPATPTFTIFTVSMHQAQAATVTLKPSMTLPKKTVCPTHSVTPSGSSRSSWLEELGDGLDLQEILQKYPQSLRTIFKKYVNSARDYNNLIAKDKYPHSM